MYGFRAANRYAKALLEYALQRNAVESVFRDMSLVHKTIEANKELDNLLVSPIVKTVVKKNVLDKVFVGVSPEVQRLFTLLIENRRLPILKQIAEKFVIHYNSYKNNETAEVITAVPLTEEMKKQVLQKVESLKQNKNITLINKVDESIIGGFILRVGDIQYNASVAFKLNKLQQEFQETLFV
ncbi:ATP synthase F1 subunit delta [Capnocytophaga canis]|uniref:ATP synthase F1 subunit delta n=1 Tax=Capnocytophaga canis TaxID=1848903 RepID=UPI0005899122|nr:ATP synthase F1 subunit delta [Capnocytophaga canis]GIM61004.1 ATP synthase subunit delta [Capnocytophaga canis]CEN44809.1 ATP synthase subunit delta [Capnocytophaga canis]